MKVIFFILTNDSFYFYNIEKYNKIKKIHVPFEKIKEIKFNFDTSCYEFLTSGKNFKLFSKKYIKEIEDLQFFVQNTNKELRKKNK